MTARPNRPLNFVRRHDRTLMWIYLGLVVLFVFVFAFPPTRNPLLDTIQRRLDAWDHRWTRRLEAGEAMVRNGEYREAVEYLARLDRKFPARSVRHARDRERERLLLALGQSYAESGEDSSALATYRRLVVFDPRNYRNYFALGALAQRQQSGTAGTDEILASYTAALRINPNHLASTRGAMLFQAAHGDTTAAGRLFKNYIDAYLLNPVTIALGDAEVPVDVPVDGVFHEYLVPLNRPAGWSGDLQINPGGYSLAIDQVALVSTLIAGRPAPRGSLPLPLSSVSVSGLAPAGPGTWRADAATGALSLALQPLATDIGAVRIRLKLFKPLDQTTWDLARAAYRNDPAELSRLSQRTIVLGSAALADSAFWRPEWAREGLLGPTTPTEGR
jgi:tetratricopeptide (TPR) repeat protein